MKKPIVRNLVEEILWHFASEPIRPYATPTDRLTLCGGKETGDHRAPVSPPIFPEDEEATDD